MPTVKCDNCGHSVEVEDATKEVMGRLLDEVRTCLLESA